MQKNTAILDMASSKMSQNCEKKSQNLKKNRKKGIYGPLAKNNF